MRPVFKIQFFSVTALFLALLFPPLPSLYGQMETEAVPLLGKQWAVFIAIDRYNEWEGSNNSVQTAKEIRDILTGNYLIHEVREFYNRQATPEAVRNFFQDLRRRIGIHDSVFVFYAGSGQIDKFTGAGSWLLSPSEEEFSPLYNRLPNEEVGSLLIDLPAKHIFLISDGCFVGEILNPQGEDEAEFTNEYYKRAYNKISRHVLTSGLVKTGPGSAQFIKSLKDTLLYPEGAYVAPAHLFTKSQDTSKPRPVLGFIKAKEVEQRESFLSKGTEHQEEGSFLFFKNILFSNPMPLVPSLSSAARTGAVTVASEIPGMIMLKGVETGIRIKANGIALLWNVPVGETDIGVKWDGSGRIVKPALPGVVEEHGTASVVIERPFMDKFVYIPGGTFMMGSPDSETGRNGDEAQGQVTVKDFYMEVQEVSVEEFRRFIYAKGYETQAEKEGGGYIWNGTVWEMIRDANWLSPYFSQEDDHPVVLVSWYDAVQYCNWRSEWEGLTPVYQINGYAVDWDENADGYRLPTEAEWEYAARAGTATPFSTGNAITTDQANFNGNYPYNSAIKGIYREKTVPADQFPPNPWGLYNMYGNVWEWCWDTYVSEEGRTYRTRRGGSWSYGGHYLRSAYRSYSVPSARYNGTGFRLVRSIPENE